MVTEEPSTSAGGPTRFDEAPERISTPSPIVPGYRLLGELGRGGMAVVYLAEQISLGRTVALKMIRGEDADEEVLARFRREAEAVARLSHRHIVQVYDFGEAQGRPFLALEYCPGGGLDARLKGQPQPPIETAQLTVHLARAVHAAHQQGIIHRDLKPANVLLAPAEASGGRQPPDGSESSGGLRLPLAGWIPKVSDFGLAKRLDSGPAMTHTRAILGTPAYMAPEQAQGHNKQIGPATDVHALGTILYEMLTGRPPFQATTPTEVLLRVIFDDPVAPRRLQPKVPRDLETICLKCLEKSPTRRYASAEELADDLERFLNHRPIRARPVRLATRVGRWCRRNPGLALVSAVAAVSLAAVVVLAIGFGLAQQRSADDLRAALRDTKQVSASLTLDQGQALCERGDVSRGLLWLAHALEIAEEARAGDLERAIRIDLAAWSRHVHPLRQQLGHDVRVRAIVFDRSGDRILTGSEDGTARLWRTTTGEPLGAALRHGAAVLTVALDAAGRVAATGGADGTARLWDTHTGAPIGPPLPHRAPVDSVLFSPDGKTLATAGGDRVLLWDAATGALRGVPLSHRDRIRAVAFAPNGQRLATASNDGTARVWRTDTGAAAGPPLTHPSEVLCLAWQPDGALLLTGSDDGTARLWEPATGRNVRTLAGHDAAVAVVAFRPDGRRILTGSVDWRARTWDGDGRSAGPLRVLRHQAPVTAAAFSPDGQTILTASLDGKARLWDADSGELLFTPMQHQAQVETAVWGPDGKLVATADKGTAARLWSVRARPALPFRLSGQGEVLSAAFGPDAHSLATGDAGGRVRLWGPTSGQAVGPPLLHDDEVSALSFSGDGRWLATGSDDRRARLWDVRRSVVRFRSPPQRDKITAVATDHDGEVLLAGTRGGAITLWDTRSGAVLASAAAHDGPVFCAVFSPDGRTVMTGGADHIARQRRSDTLEVLGPALVHQGLVRCAAFAPAGDLLATGGADNAAALWAPLTGEAHGPPLLDWSPVQAAAFSPDGQLLALGYRDNTARLWDVKAHKPLGESLRHPETVLAAVFDPDGRHLRTATAGGTLHVHPVPAPLSVDAPRLVLWCQVITGMELDASGGTRLLDRATWQRRRQQLQQLGGPPVDH